MAEIGIDISGHRSKSVDEFVGRDPDFAITVCNQAQETCPIFPGTVKRLHWPFDDPAAVQGSDEVRQAAFRKIRNQIHGRIMVFLNGDESVV
jgi:arsenate reductase